MSTHPIQLEEENGGYSLKSFCIPPSYQPYLKNVLIPHGLIQDRVECLAADIVADIGEEPLTALCVLKGGYRFFADLLEKINRISCDKQHSLPVAIEFIRLKSYENDSSTGEVRVLGVEDLSHLKDRNVLVVEDIVDTGTTIGKLNGLLQKYQPRSVKVASLLVKRRADNNNTPCYSPTYAGFEIPDKFVVGYALDYNEYFRDLNHICVINEAGIEKFSS